MKAKIAVLATLFLSSLSTAASAQSAIVSSVQPLDQPGLYLARAEVRYPDGDALLASFRVYCPTQTIRPTNYELYDSMGHLKDQGSWWENAFTPQYASEHQLVRNVCGG